MFNRPNFDIEKVKAFVAKYGSDAKFPAVFAENVITPYVQTEVSQELMGGLFLESRNLQPGESAAVYVEPGMKAVVVDEKGRSILQTVESNKIEPPNFHVDAFVRFRKSDLRLGVVRPLDAQGDDLNSLLKAKVDKACLEAALASVPDTNIIACPGATLTEQALRSAMVRIAKMDKKFGFLFADASRVMLDMADFKMNSESVKDDFVRRGVIAMWGGAAVSHTSRMPEDKVLLIANELIGRCMIVDGPVVEPDYSVGAGWIGLYAEMTVRIGIGKGNLVSRVDIG